MGSGASKLKADEGEVQGGSTTLSTPLVKKTLASHPPPPRGNPKHSNNQPPIHFTPGQTNSAKFRDVGYTGDFFGQRPRNTDSLFNAVFAPPPRSDSDIERSAKKRREKKRHKEAMRREKERKRSLAAEDKKQRGSGEVQDQQVKWERAGREQGVRGGTMW